MGNNFAPAHQVLQLPTPKTTTLALILALACTALPTAHAADTETRPIAASAATDYSALNAPSNPSTIGFFQSVCLLIVSCGASFTSRIVT